MMLLYISSGNQFEILSQIHIKNVTSVLSELTTRNTSLYLQVVQAWFFLCLSTRREKILFLVSKLIPSFLGIKIPLMEGLEDYRLLHVSVYILPVYSLKHD